MDVTPSPLKGQGVGISGKEMISLVSLSFSLVWFKWVDLPPCLLIMTDERPINPETWMKMMKQLVAKKTMHWPGLSSSLLTDSL